ncbi:MAG: hypothetical protein ACRENE_00885 [Polyangiaceae bacterium]
MARTERFEGRSSLLRELGVPPSVVAYIEEQVYPDGYRAAYVAYLTGFLLVILGVPLGAGLAVFRITRHIAAARANDGYVVVENHGWAMLVLGLGLLLWPGPATQGVVRGRFAEYCAIRGLVMSRETRGAAGAITRWVVRKAARRVPSGEPHAFLHEHSRVVARWFVWTGSALTVVGLALVPVDIGRYDVVDAAGIAQHSVFGTSSRRWTSSTTSRPGAARTRTARDSTRAPLTTSSSPTRRPRVCS